MAFGNYAALGLYFLAMLGIGLYAYRQTASDAAGYMLGGRRLGPAVVALSAGASDMSGWILMGLPGALYVSGLSSAWIAVGLLAGAYANYLLVAPRLRTFTVLANDSITLPDFFENRFEDRSRILRIVSALVIIIFFTLYTSSGVVAGGKLFESSFGLSYVSGLYVTAGVVVLYTLVGGFTAVSMTDFLQGSIMFAALVLVPATALLEVGGVGAAVTQLNQVNPQLLDIIGSTSLLAIISSLAWGLGYFGQPHIIVRFMAIEKVSQLKSARRIGMSWMLVTLLGAMTTGLVGIVYMRTAQIPLKDAETIFIVLSQLLFSPLVSGFFLAAILAAIMSTISSQLLVSSSSLAGDLYKTFIRPAAGDAELVFVARLSVLLVAVMAVLLAFDRDNNILSLVGNAWAGFGAAFGPLILFSLFWRGMTATGAIAGILVGAGTVLVWIYAPVSVGGHSLGELIYEIVPGFVLASVAIVVGSHWGEKPSEAMDLLFTEMESTLAAKAER